MICQRQKFTALIWTQWRKSLINMELKHSRWQLRTLQFPADSVSIFLFSTIYQMLDLFFCCSNSLAFISLLSIFSSPSISTQFLYILLFPASLSLCLYMGQCERLARCRWWHSMPRVCTCVYMSVRVCVCVWGRQEICVCLYWPPLSASGNGVWWIKVDHHMQTHTQKVTQTLWERRKGVERLMTVFLKNTSDV